jgi:hypothetical protein
MDTGVSAEKSGIPKIYFDNNFGGNQYLQKSGLVFTKLLAIILQAF